MTVKEQKKVFHVNGNFKKSGVALIISGKINFKSEAKRQRRSFHNDNEVNLPRVYNSSKP